MKNIVVIGKNSLIYSDIKAKLKFKKILEFSHNEINILKKKKLRIDYIIYFGFDKKIHNSVDRKIINFSKDRDIHLIYFSSRKLYKFKRKYFYKETDAIVSSDKYSLIKKNNEEYIRKNLIYYTILRLGTYIPDNFSLIKKNKSFISTFINNIRKGFIYFDFNLNTEKDFLFNRRLRIVLTMIIKSNLIGTFNLSSGYPLKIKDIIKNIHRNKNYEIITKNKKIKDAFILNNKKINNKLKNKYSSKLFKSDFKQFMMNLNKFINSF